MQRVKFVLLTVLILLSGAVLSGLAAWKVVSPPAGEPVSAGVVPIPSVLGQTADEVLFYPWSLYGMQPLSPLPEEELDYVTQTMPKGNLLCLVAAIESLGVTCDTQALIRAQVYNRGNNTNIGTAGTMFFLKDFPAVLTDGGVPVSLDYALSDTHPLSVSWLMRPKVEASLTEQQRQEALDKVQNDLAGLIWYNLRERDRNFENDLTTFLTRFDTLQDFGLMFYEWLAKWIELMYLQYSGSVEVSEEESGLQITVSTDGQGEDQEPPHTLEEILAMGQGELVDIQFITTPRQIVLLFTLNSGTNIGIYYDIQLGRYSGLGMSA